MDVPGALANILHQSVNGRRTHGTRPGGTRGSIALSGPFDGVTDHLPGNFVPVDAFVVAGEIAFEAIGALAGTGDVGSVLEMQKQPLAKLHLEPMRHDLVLVEQN